MVWLIWHKCMFHPLQFGIVNHQKLGRFKTSWCCVFPCIPILHHFNLTNKNKIKIKKKNNTQTLFFKLVWKSLHLYITELSSSRKPEQSISLNFGLLIYPKSTQNTTFHKYKLGCWTVIINYCTCANWCSVNDYYSLVWH